MGKKRQSQMYQYLGNERLQFDFFSPNVLAAFLIMSIMLAIGGFGWALQCKSRRTGYAVAGCLLLAILLQMTMLAVTYSRGGYVAALVVLVGAALVLRQKWGWIFPVLLVVVLLLTNSGVSRVKSIADVGDGSIRNRFLLWKGGTGIIADHWLGGVETPGAVGDIYYDWYQPLWLDEHYGTLINDSLTLAALYGIWLPVLLLAIILWLLHNSLRYYRRCQNPLLLYTVAAVVGYLIAGSFTTCYRFGDVIWLFGLSLAMLALFVGYGAIRRKIDWRPRDFWPAPVLALCYGLAIVGYGAWVNRELPYRWASAKIDSFEYLTVSPAARVKGDLIAVLHDRKNAVREFLRPFAGNGYRVTAIFTEPGMAVLDDGAAAIRKIAMRHASPPLLIGIGNEPSIQTLALSNRLSGKEISQIVAVDLPDDWPFPDLSPKEQVTKSEIPLRIFYRPGGEASAEELKKLGSGKRQVKAFIFTGKYPPVDEICKNLDRGIHEKP